MELEQKYWTGEPIKMTIYIDNDVYTSQTNSTSSEKFIQSLTFTKSEGNNNVNPLGIASSDRVTIVCFDINDYLSPANIKGIYSGRLTNGLKVELEISKDMGETWEPYGTYYTTSFSGSYSDGIHSTVSISCEDKLNILGNTLVPELDVYANVKIGELIVKLFTALGYSQDSYYIDPKLDTDILWGILPGTKIRDFLNSVCQRMFARVIIDNMGIIRFIPALQLPTLYNSITLTPNDIGTMSNNNQTSINYSAISVVFYIYGENKEVELYNKNDVALAVGHNTIDNITFTNDVICVNSVEVDYQSELGIAEIKNLDYVAYQDGMIISLDLEGSSVYSTNIIVRGVVNSQLTDKVSINLNTGGREGLTEYTFEVKSVMNNDEALELCNQIATYINTLKNQIKITGTILTPFLNTGDRLIIQGTGTMYDGTYKIMALNTNFNESYKMDLDLIRIE